MRKLFVIACAILNSENKTGCIKHPILTCLKYTFAPKKKKLDFLDIIYKLKLKHSPNYIHENNDQLCPCL